MSGVLYSLTRLGPRTFLVGALRVGHPFLSNPHGATRRPWTVRSAQRAPSL